MKKKLPCKKNLQATRVVWRNGQFLIKQLPFKKYLQIGTSFVTIIALEGGTTTGEGDGTSS